ncbi:mitochondrial mRNA pseudouridine synthase Trub2 [Belonocnema kinseyi]|uniref:mitochondrial mRNA pseudouridine synthase Trub2 n=1 Tax=Belonocnema kinseyi TaxID=2817044 RepID=UPI00143D0696|nr:mitochondrial mRNA pseudouridine synthase Trub2 [Belonocnema kinseyi]XP_033228001.1 mitochondrial mRNA pseudouridine synthase Trub2 [Belonocnema kinseyi]XP_033228002.1 mitochondrial mRNA pseudouridine synthase Trub2 [Belonocnema kinseyi]
MSYTNDARAVWKMLNGVFIIYKPARVPLMVTRETISRNLCRDLNALKVRPPDPYVLIEGETNKKLRVSVRPSFADNVLVVGPRYQPQDFKINWANHLYQDTTGVVVCGVNDGCKLIHKIKRAAPTRFYRVKGILGKATDTHFITGKIIEKSTYQFLRRTHIDRVCAAMQSSHQKKMFEVCGIDIQSQAAYELAVKGLIRPLDNRIPMLYSIKCVDFQSPEFTIEIVCINENEMYLKSIIHELGMEMKSTATCSQIHCFQYGIFNVEQALLTKSWNLRSILESIESCDELLRKNSFLLEQEHPNLIAPHDEDLDLIEEENPALLEQSQK